MGMGWVGVGVVVYACANEKKKKKGIIYWKQAAHYLVGDISIEFYEVSLNWES